MIIEEILKRKTVREFESEEIPDEFINDIIKAGQFAPSGHGIHAIEFIIIKEQKTKDAIFKIAGQEFLKQAPVLLLLLCDTKKTDLAIQDLSVATENIFLQAASMGLGTAWKNLSPEWEEKIKKLLGVPQNYKAINIIPLGFPSNAIEPHNDGEFHENKIHKERW